MILGSRTSHSRYLSTSRERKCVYLVTERSRAPALSFTQCVKWPLRAAPVACANYLDCVFVAETAVAAAAWPVPARAVPLTGGQCPLAAPIPDGAGPSSLQAYCAVGAASFARRPPPPLISRDLTG